MSRLSISGRLAVLSAAALTALLLVVGVVVHHQLGAGLRAGIDQQLVDLAGALPARLAEGDVGPAGAGDDDARDDAGDDGGDAGDDGAGEAGEFAGLELSDRLVQIVDGQGRLVTSSDEVDADGPLLGPADLDRARAGDATLRTVTEGDDDLLRVLAVPYGEPGHVAIVAAELDDVQDAQQALVAVYGPIALLGVAVAGLLGYAIARRGLAPVRRMTEEAEAIGGADLSRRLSAPARLDEVGRLSRTLNAMLARVEAATSRERAFTADASHELRTPLAILQAEVELARDRVDDPAVRSALGTALDEGARVAGLVDDLLVLARADAVHHDHRPVDLGELVDVVVARFSTLAGRRQVELRSRGAAVVRGDASSLERAVANLVDNALRHTPEGGRVTVDVEAAGPGGAAIVVSDTGPGVPPERLASLFDRFSRVDDARHEPGGAGLGLAIVAAVAAAHAGDVTAANRASGGLCITVSLGQSPQQVG